MIAPPGTALMLEPGGLDAPQDELSISSSQQHQQAEVVAEEQPEEEYNRVIVHRRTSEQVGQLLSRKDPTGVEQHQQQLVQQKIKVLTVRPSYSSIRTNIIRLTPESMKCKLYCKGIKCIYCTPESWSAEQQAIKGLYSNWINDELLAMARPTCRTFEEFDLINQFKKAGIRTVLNLQCVKEHDFCGAPLVQHTGFSYDPEILMREKVYYFNFAIPDFGTTSVKSILDICKVIWFAKQYGRVAIHCHAGLGRTGTLIACFLVWSKALLPAEAIDTVRTARPNSIQSIEQINIVEEFSYHMQKYGTALPSFCYASNGVSLRQLMVNQRQFLPSDEARRYAHIPKMLFKLGDRLLRMVFEQNGIQYVPREGHHARSCTFGTICVNWRNAFTQRGKLQVRQVVNLFARITAFPYEKDQALIAKFQQLSLVNAEAEIAELDTPQLISLLNAFLESIKRPYCSRRSLVDALGHFSPDNPTVLPEDDQEGNENSMDHEEVELIKMLMNPVGDDSESAGIRTDRREINQKGPSAEVEKVVNPDTDSGVGKAVENGNIEEANIEIKIENGNPLVEAVQEEEPNEPETTVEASETEHGNETEAVQSSENETESGIGMVQTREHGTESGTVQPREHRTESETETVQARNDVRNAHNAQTDNVSTELTDETVQEQQLGAVQVDEHQFTMQNCAINYGGISLDQKQETTSTNKENEAMVPSTSTQRPSTVAQPKNTVDEQQRPVTVGSSVVNAVVNGDVHSIYFDHHDSHTNKEASLSADWQCVVFYVCNLISFLTGENYDTLVDLLTFWFTGDNNRDVKQAVYCHMRDLFARNMRQQEQQAAEWRRTLGLPDKKVSKAKR